MGRIGKDKILDAHKKFMCFVSKNNGINIDLNSDNGYAIIIAGEVSGRFFGISFDYGFDEKKILFDIKNTEAEVIDKFKEQLDEYK